MRCLHCERRAHAKGLCVAHYQKLRKYGDPLAGYTIMRGASLEDQFRAKVSIRGEAECWYWTGCVTSAGYGLFTWDRSRLPGRGTGAHRFAYGLAYGPLPAGMTVDHACHTLACPGGRTCLHRRCVNPSHLRAMTQQENSALGHSTAAVNARKTHCVNGHELSPENVYASQWPARICKLCARDRASRHRQGGYVRPSRRH